LQETLMRAWRAMQTFGGDEHLHARLFKFGRCAGRAFLPSSSRERHQIGTNTAFSSSRWVSSFMRP
jgi:DNA-directed RNA polymerase specialized sigma24 family protein